MKRTAGVLGALGSVALVAAVLALVASLDAEPPPSLWFPRGYNLPIAVVLLAMGWLLAVRRPGNAVTWSLIVAGVAAALQATAIELSILAHDRGSDAVGVWSAFAVELLWPTIVVGLVHAMARFPGGRPRGLQRLASPLAAVAGAALTIANLLVAGPFGNVSWYENPVGAVEVAPTSLLRTAAFVPFLALVAVALVGFVSGYRRSQGVERQQYRWVVASAVPFLVSIILLPFSIDGTTGTPTSPVVLANTISTTLVPIGMAVAIVRYRLYDLDRVLSRTVAWTLLTGCVVGLWAAIALLPAAVVGAGDGDGGSSNVLVAGATVVAAAAFNPLRRRLQDLVDRRLHRERYDARREVEELGSRLAGAVQLETITEHVVDVLDHTVAPTTAAVWTPSEPVRR